MGYGKNDTPPLKRKGRPNPPLGLMEKIKKTGWPFSEGTPKKKNIENLLSFSHKKKISQNIWGKTKKKKVGGFSLNWKKKLPLEKKKKKAKNPPFSVSFLKPPFSLINRKKIPGKKLNLKWERKKQD